MDGEHFRRRWPAPIKQSTLGRFCDLLLPFVDSYFLVLLGAVRLLPDQVMEEKAFIAKIQSVGERLYFSGEMDHYEAVGKETLQQVPPLCLVWGGGGGSDAARQRACACDGVRG